MADPERGGLKCTIRKENGAPKVEIQIKGPGPGQLPDGTDLWVEHYCRFELHTPHVERETPRHTQNLATSPK